MNKYRAKKIVTSDGAFDSKKEYKRWLILKEMEEAGTIKDLCRQVPFELVPTQKLNGKVIERSVKYYADFAYTVDGVQIVEDVKSPITRKKPDYILKRKLLLYKYGIQLKEV